MGIVGNNPQPFLALEQFAHLTAQFQMRHHLSGQDTQRLLLRLRQGAWLMVNDTQRSQRRVLRSDQRRTRIKADAWITRDQRILREAFILRGIRHDEQVAVMQGVSAESDIARRLRHFCADPRLVPLAMLIDQGDHGNRGSANLRRQGGQIV